MSRVQSIERAFAVLGALTDGPIGVTEVADRAALPKSTAARMLAAAADRRLRLVATRALHGADHDRSGGAPDAPPANPARGPRLDQWRICRGHRLGGGGDRQRGRRDRGRGPRPWPVISLSAI